MYYGKERSFFGRSGIGGEREGVALGLGAGKKRLLGSESHSEVK